MCGYSTARPTNTPSYKVIGRLQQEQGGRKTQGVFCIPGRGILPQQGCDPDGWIHPGLQHRKEKEP